ncbi:MAG TPA: di-heme oxidoredictase family protein [Polyangiaceae bacterium]
MSNDDNQNCEDVAGDCSAVQAQIIATGIPGAGAIAQVGFFHRGDAVHDSAALNGLIQPGQVLGPERIIVASTSNFGEPMQQTSQYPGTLISIEPGDAPVAVPADFATAGSQASALGGAVTVYSANNAAFLNSRFNPGAVTASQVGASLCTGFSINSGNGRPWASCAPNGASGEGTITVLDPDGAPLKGAPDPVAGGIFAGNETNRNAASTHGLVTGALGLAIMTKSSDGTGKAVFASREADGSIVQIHVLKGVDGLVPPGTLTPISTVTPDTMNSTDPNVVSRVGMAFNWVPNHTLYVADPQTNQLVAFDITADGTLFYASAPRYLDAHHHLHVPIDVSPTEPEVASENFSANTTLAAAADLYVLNRGDNSIVRVNQSGQVIAVRHILVDGLDGFRVNGLGVSPDGKDIWVSAQTPNNGGVVLHVPGFGSGPIMPGLMSDAANAGNTTLQQLGTHFFTHSFAVNEGVGPLFNGQACLTCHGDPAPGGMGNNAVDVLVGEFEHGTFEPLENDRGPVARQHSISELGAGCGLQAPGTPPDTNAFSPRSAMTLRGTSLLDFILDNDILKNQALEPAAVQGHPNILADGRIGRFGWKADQATLVEFMGHAFRNEMGLTNNIAPKDEVDGCGADAIKPEIDSVPLETAVTFIQTIDPPAPTSACLASPGAAVFNTAGCNGCHTPAFNGPGQTIRLYSDLLLHDMGPALADGFVDNSASGSEFRTMTLANLGDRSHFLHDGRAHSVTEAIQDHGGQGAAAAAAFDGLSASDQAALLAFLGCL